MRIRIRERANQLPRFFRGHCRPQTESPKPLVLAVFFSRRLLCGLWLVTQFPEVSLRKQALGLGGLAGRWSGFLRQFGQDLHAAGRDEDCVLELCGPETHRGAVRTLVCTGSSGCRCAPSLPSNSNVTGQAPLVVQ